MRNAFIVSAALLLVGTVGGGYTAYHLGTSHEEKAAGSAGETKSPAAVMNNDAASAGVSPAAGQAPATGDAAPASTEGKSVSDASGAAAAPAAGESGTTPAGTPAGNKADSLSAGSMPTSGASQSPNAAGNKPGDNQPAGNASAAEGASVVATDRASGTSSTTAAPGAPTKPTNAANPSGSAPAPDSTSAAAAAPASGAATSGDAEAGKLIFAGAKKPEVNCAVCHGAQGKGGVGANLTTPDGPKGWDETQFLMALRQGQTPQKMLNATMPRFADTQLSDTEINDIHAFIKTLP
ncbi:hypothetical protein EHF33_05255 [Deinococcus psychrotolerans]|uniref:Cytochrome c domain-containing protein n=1 Tax=Deinococcus psychrotolerans TaxID=2489213 RepID=A0A3G8YA32_9DEIO|nr:cytochrome c [Deinococcus psychrotolerans]AZI42229.1 hypothetical protein EHF33_05255 [Deinococcus psychrotolerans]